MCCLYLSTVPYKVVNKKSLNGIHLAQVYLYVHLLNEALKCELGMGFKYTVCSSDCFPPGLDSSHPSFGQLVAFRLLGPRSGKVVLTGLLFHCSSFLPLRYFSPQDLDFQ